jgi:uncharacterized protein YraI
MLHNRNISKYFYILLAVLLLGGALAPAWPALAAGELKAVVIVEALNLREGPGFDYDVLKVLARGQELSVLRSSEAGDWSEVLLSDGKAGWVYSIYIRAETGADATVNVERLNLRAGPAFNTRVLKVLDLGQELSVEGRSEDGNWLQVSLSAGTAGWVYRFFVDTDRIISDLPVKEASGGPDTGEPEAKPSYNILVTIDDNRAAIDLAGFPAGKSFSVALGLPGEEPDQVVAEGKTSSTGSARESFEMPAKWSGGDEIEENRLLVTVTAEDGSFTKSVNIQYYRW